jgi:hypothetical protein
MDAARPTKPATYTSAIGSQRSKAPFKLQDLRGNALMVSFVELLIRRQSQIAAVSCRVTGLAAAIVRYAIGFLIQYNAPPLPHVPEKLASKQFLPVILAAAQLKFA